MMNDLQLTRAPFRDYRTMLRISHSQAQEIALGLEALGLPTSFDDVGGLDLEALEGIVDRQTERVAQAAAAQKVERAAYTKEWRERVEAIDATTSPTSSRRSAPRRRR